MRFYRDPQYVKFTPFATTCLLEFANVCQLWRMWTRHTAEGQNIIGWITVNLALCLWLNWYTVFTPEQRFAIWATRLGIFINFAVIFTVYHFS